MMWPAVAAIGVLAIIGVMAWALRHAGKSDAQNDQLRDNLDAVKKANEARDSLADPAVVVELHKKYTR